MQRSRPVSYFAVPVAAAIVLSACSSMHPDTQLTVSNTRPEVISPMQLRNPQYPLIAWEHNALPSKTTACFNVDRNGHAHDVTITDVSIPDSGDKKLDRKIRAALAAAVRRSVSNNRFWPVKVNGKRVDSPRVCQDYLFTRRKYELSRRGTWTISRPRPKDAIPIVRIAPLVPEIVLKNNASKSTVTACFDIERNGRTSDVKITRIAIPDTGKKKLNREIETQLGAAVLGAVEQSLFSPRKGHGKTEESPHVCEDYTLHSRR